MSKEKTPKEAERTVLDKIAETAVGLGTLMMFAFLYKKANSGRW